VLASSSSVTSAKAAVRVQTSLAAGALNGAAANGSQVATAVVPSISRLLIGSRSSDTSLNSGSWWNDYIQRIVVPSVVPSDAQLQALTAA